MNKTTEPYLLVIGASVIDIFGFSKATYRSHNSTPGRVKLSYGGVCRNIAENMARVGVNTKFISILGDDENGYNMMSQSKEIGYDMSDSLIVEGAGTPTYLAILDENGEMVSAIADLKIINALDQEFLSTKAEIISNAEYVVLDSDNPKTMEYLLLNYGDNTKFILDPVSAARAENIRHLVRYFHTIKPNRHEAEVLAGFPIKSDEDLLKAGEYFLSLGVKNVFISLDEEGIFFTNGKKWGKTKARDVLVKNVTGAGDAFVAGLGYGYMNNLSLEEIVKLAITMSTITIAHEETIHPKMDINFVNEELNSLDWEQITYK
ncbi:carbohydrate kinase family protein [Clostridium fallax]|uniref:Pseudouridine kinase n=1 Tax=Clostridium fallax TaxID=1533 RepID=A0A1M4VWB0_9CLOT|nr:carbohydrate kinase family protein [Clostridium fallax]SHE73163.1 pseudouridine kinase [Clostridium fallax]SQB07723.1 sugar kinase [Clostridium fallax]